MNLSDCAILIPTRNRPAILATTLLQLRQFGLQTLPLWVYDDASDDAKAISDAVATRPGAQVIRGATRVGQAKGRNVLLRACNCEYAIMLEDDTYFTEMGNLSKHIAEHASRRHFAVLGFQCVRKRDGLLGTPADQRAGPTSSFMGGACLFHVPSILGVGGYREFFIYGHEEPELAMRLWFNGLQLLYDPAIVVEHNQEYSPAENRSFREYDRLYARNGVLVHSLNLPLWFGLPFGFVKSLKWCFHTARNPGAKLRGLSEGVGATFRYRKARTPVSLGQALAWRRFCQSKRGGGEAAHTTSLAHSSLPA